MGNPVGTGLGLSRNIMGNPAGTGLGLSRNIMGNPVGTGLGLSIKRDGQKNASNVETRHALSLVFIKKKPERPHVTPALVENIGLEPMTSWLPAKRSSQLS